MNNPSSLLVVKDLQQSKDFYVNILGLEIVEEHKDAVKLKLNDHEVFMFQGTSRCIDYEHGSDANSTLIFSVVNLDQKIEELESVGIEIVHDVPSENKWGRYSGFKDPSGIVHEIMEFKI